MGNQSIAVGSLVIAVPSAEGLVFAADSRLCLYTPDGPQIFSDSEYKIHIPSLPLRTAFAITGYSTGYPQLKPGRYLTEDLARHLRTVKPRFDIAADLKNSLKISRANEL